MKFYKKQLTVAYPVVRNIIKTCAARFDEVNKECGDNVRSITMDHLIEKNSGN